MASIVSICNLALSHIGSNPIQDLDEGSTGANACVIHYDQARQTALADHDWNFARKRLTLALLSDTYSGWDLAYQYPIDCLAARSIYDGTGSFTGTSSDLDPNRNSLIGAVQFEIAVQPTLDGKMILTNQGSAELKYTANVQLVNLFSPLFTEALSHLLASSLVMTIKKDKKLRESEFLLYNSLNNRATARDANESEIMPREVNTLTRSRN